MEFEQKLEIFTICMWQIIGLTALLCAFIIMYMKARKTASRRAFFMVVFAIGLWLVGKIFKTVSPTVELRWTFVVVYYAAICMLEAAFLEFGFAYRYGRNFTRKERMIAYILPVIQFITVATNPHHYLFYSSFNFIRDKFGPLFYVLVFIEYIYIFIGMFLCSAKMRIQFKGRSRAYRHLVGVAVVGPILLNLLYISRVLARFFEILGIRIIFDVTPIIFTWSLLLFVYATFKYEFMDTSPIMKYEIIHRIDTPICMLNSFGEMVFGNDYFTGLKVSDDIVKQIYEGLLTENQKKNYLEIDSKSFIYFTKTITNIDGYRYVIVFNDISEIEEARRKIVENSERLELANEQLSQQIEVLKDTSKISAKNYVARELHDIIGHSLVVTMKLIEVSKLSLPNNTEMAQESIIKAKSVTENGITDMKNLMDNGYTMCNSRLLKRELKTLVNKVKGDHFDVSFFFKGDEKSLDTEVYDTVIKVTKELITNTIKHATADRLLLSYTANTGHIRIHAMDNGVGCDKLKKGNGLKGIEYRVKAVAGTVKFSTKAGEGFSAVMHI